MNRVTALDDDDMVGGEPIHQDRPIGVRQRGILGRDEQFTGTGHSFTSS